MKKLFLIGTFSALSFAGIAQNSSIGIQAGANMSSPTIKDGSGSSFSKDMKIGLLAGIVIEVPFSESIGFRPEINFIQKGHKISSKETIGSISYTDESEATLNYVEIPLNFVYNIPAGANHVFVGLGPSFGYGLSGKVKSKSTVTGQATVSDENKIEFGNDKAKDDLKPFDFGGNILAGFKMNNGLFFKAAYSMGLINIDLNTNSTYKNNGFSFTIGYMFKKGENFSKDY